MWNKIKTEDYIQKNFVISVTKLQGWQYISFHKKKTALDIRLPYHKLLSHIFPFYQFT